MNKNARIVLAILFVLGLVLMSAPHQAQAKENEISPLIAGGSWTAGQAVDVTTLAAKAPTWLQLLTNGVRVTEAGKICHPFRGGQFGWIGEIRQYKSGEWFKLKTTNDWVNGTEGQFMSCAEAPAAGTYALFGYWIRPAGYVVADGAPGFDCNTIEWGEIYVGADGNILISGSGSNLPDGTRFYYTVVSSTPDLESEDPASGYDTLSENFFGIDTGLDGDYFDPVIFTLYEGLHNCTYPGTLIYSSFPG